jgi:hypothetical protein
MNLYNEKKIFNYSKNNENVTCLRIMRKKIVTYENLRKTYENKILIF